MHSHLKHIHKRSIGSDQKTPGQMKLQTSLVSWQASRRKLTTSKYEDITKSIALMCATDLRPTSIVGGKGFKKVMFKMNPDYHVPSPATISKYLGVAYDEEVKVLINAIQGKDVAVTTDLWTSVGQRSYITVTGHHIDSEWELKANILATKTVDDRHTGENIARHVKDIMQSFNIKLSSIVTDNASNMITAAETGNFDRLSCFAHTIQLCINDGLKQKAIAKATGGAKRIIGHFSHSPLSTNAILDQQRRLNPSERPVKLIQDVQTRWNSIYLMMKRLLALRVPLVRCSTGRQDH